jgi:hypothetical protein
VSKVETLLPLFAMGTIATEHTDHFLMEVETEAKKGAGELRTKTIRCPQGSKYHE